MPEPTVLYGLLAEFEHPEELLAGARRAHETGYRRIDAYTPIPVDGLSAALGHVPGKLPRITLLGGLLGAAAGYGLQYYVSVIDNPWNVGGRPLHSWPAFLPIVFEMAVLGASLFAVLGMLALNGLPMPYHPLFNLPEFKLASRDRFFLCIESRDKSFDLARTRQFLEELHPKRIHEVPR